ncbi:MAG: YggT family protein [Ruminococcaceae bacterium]|nr:YggT family protein [Oscillospiraceae bacterium]
MLILFLQRFAFTVIRMYEILLIVRAILSWLPLGISNPIVNFVYSLTEPVLAPVRNFLFRFQFFQSLPIDLSLLVVYILLDVVRSVLFML